MQQLMVLAVVLGIAYLVVLPILVIVLMVQMSDVKARLVAAERQRDRPDPTTAPVAAPAQMAPAQTPLETRPSLPQKTQPTTQLVEKTAETPISAISEARFSPTKTQGPDQAVVLSPDRANALMDWLGANWVYVVSAASLAFAGVFFVQYGMQNGLLPPGLRVIFGLGFGAILIGAGEWLRRRHGDTGAHQMLPQVFSGAGMVSAFAAVVGARLLYGLIGVETAFTGQVIIAAIAVYLGWINGPVLVAVGLIGAAAAPFLVAGGAAPAAWLFAYYALIAVAGLAVDAYRRWAWLSVLALVLGFGGGWLMYLGGGDDLPWITFLAFMPFLATIVPAWRLVPDHAGPTLLATLTGYSDGIWPIFPTRLVLGTTAFAVFNLLVLTTAQAEPAQIAFGILSVLAVVFLLWADRADGLADIALLPAAGILAAIALGALVYTPLSGNFANQAIQMRPSETGAPWSVSLILLGAVLVSLAFAARALGRRDLPIVHGLGAVLTAPMAAAGLELAWNPAPVLGAYPWALHTLAVAALMVVLAVRFAAPDGTDRRRAAHATLSALALIALALFILTTQTALTLALAALIVAAAFLDRRFALPEMGWFSQAAVAVLSWRLVVDPGLNWASYAPMPQVLLAFGGVIAALLVGLSLIRGRGRDLTEGVLTSAAWGFGAIAANIVIQREIVETWRNGDFTHWGLALHAMPWLVVGLVQLYRAGLGGAGWIIRLRYFLAAAAGILAIGTLAMAVVGANPLFWDSEQNRILGAPFFGSLMLAYFLPGGALFLAALSMPVLPAQVRTGLRWLGAGMLAVYAVLSLRQFWHGPRIGLERGVMQPELYSYTVALLALGAVLLWQALARRSPALRRLAMGVIAVTVAKVFFIDITGLTGLTRVASFLGLGLALAGLAWLNRWAGQEIDDRSTT